MYYFEKKRREIGILIKRKELEGIPKDTPETMKPEGYVKCSKWYPSLKPKGGNVIEDNRYNYAIR